MSAKASAEVARPLHPWVAAADDAVRFGVTGAFTEWADLLHFARAAEDGGFDAFWWNDHTTWAFDPWAVLAAVATTTTQIRLLTLASCIAYRPPALLARLAADVDRLSGGRLVLGIGIGDDAAEFRQLGQVFSPVPERQAALDEYVQMVKGAWGDVSYWLSGRYFRAEGLRVTPGPVQSPHVPFLIAGGGERVTLRQVARHADMSNFGPHEWTGSAFGLDDVRRKYEVLHRYCEEIGRPFESILRSIYVPSVILAPDRSTLQAKIDRMDVGGPRRYTPIHCLPEEAIPRFQELIDAGAQYFLVVITGEDLETLELLSQRVTPELDVLRG